APGIANRVLFSEWDGGTIDVGAVRVMQITGDRFGALDGNFTGNLLLRDGAAMLSANNIRIAGRVTDSTIQARSDIRAFNASHLIDSELLVGLTSGFETLNGLLPDSVDDFDVPADLRVLRLTGTRGSDEPALQNSV